MQFSCKKQPKIVTNIPIENNSTANLGKVLFEEKGMCATCHKPDAKVIGPSIKKIVTIYSVKKPIFQCFY